MKYKLRINTFNPDVIDAMEQLGKKKDKLAEMAIESFLASRKGREALGYLLDDLSGKEKRHVSKDKNVKTEKPDASHEETKTTPTAQVATGTEIIKPAENGKKAKINLDKFL